MTEPTTDPRPWHFDLDRLTGDVESDTTELLDALYEEWAPREGYVGNFELHAITQAALELGLVPDACPSYGIEWSDATFSMHPECYADCLHGQCPGVGIVHHPSGEEVTWYKRIGRSQARHLSEEASWDCVRSLVEAFWAGVASATTPG